MPSTLDCLSFSIEIRVLLLKTIRPKSLTGSRVGRPSFFHKQLSLLLSMFLFLFPKALCRDIDSSLRKLWWGFLQDKRKMPLTTWLESNMLSYSCWWSWAEEYGMQNRSLMAKIGWNCWLTNTFLWVHSLSAKYLQSTTFLSSHVPPSASWLWKGVLNCRDVVQKGAYWSVSTGLELNIWDSPWIPILDGFKPTPNLSLSSIHPLNISDLISSSSRDWNQPLALFNSFFILIATQIKAIHLSRIPYLDRWIWTPVPNGIFSAKSAHELASAPTSLNNFPLIPTDWRLLWSLQIQYRLKHLLWRISWSILPVRTNISEFLPNASEEMLSCPFCSPQKNSSAYFLRLSFC